MSPPRESAPSATETAAARLTVAVADQSEAAVLQNLMQFYVHDFSAFWAGAPRGEVGEDGRFSPYPLDDYWTRPNWTALLIRRDQHLAGFALVNDHAHDGRPVDHSMAEFFVLRKHRGCGLGRRAAELVFGLWPGSWEVAVARANVAAAGFWRRTIAAGAVAGTVEERDLRTDDWNGPVIRFDWPQAGA